MKAFALVLLVSLVLTPCWAQEGGAASGEERVLDSGEPGPAIDNTEVIPPADTKQALKAISVNDVKVTLITSDGKKKSSDTVAFGKKALKDMQLLVKQTLELAIKPKVDGKEGRPQQAMLMLASADGLAAYAVPKVSKKDLTHTFTISQGLVEKQLGKRGGDLKVSLLLGDPAAGRGVSWELGVVQLPEDVDAVAAPKYLTALHQPVSNTKPEIRHIFRSPEKRPPAVVSLVFTALAVAPLAVLVLALPQLGSNFQALPSGASHWVMLFHGSIAGMLGLYILFWTKFNLAQIMPLVGGLGLVVAATGYKALSALSAERTGGATSESKKIN